MFRLAFREIRNHPRFSAFFVLNLALGFLGFVVLDAFEASISGALRDRSRSFLGGDIDVGSRRPLSDRERALLDEIAGTDARAANATVLFSMAAGEERVRLAEVYAVDAAFPLYGGIELDGSGPTGERERQQLEQERGAWIDPALAGQLGVGVGQRLRLGASDFLVTGIIDRDGGRATGGFSIAPRIYVSSTYLADTELVQRGSRVQYRRLYGIADGADPGGLTRAMRQGISDSGVVIRSHEEATRELAGAYAAVSDYLGLVALIAVFLAGLGAAHLFRAHLARRVKDIAILVSLGATRRRAQLVFLAQLAWLSVLAAAAAWALGALLLPLATRAAAGFLPVDFAPRAGGRTLGLVAALAFVGSVASCLPFLARIRDLRPAQLFAEQAQPSLGRRPADVLLLLPALAAFWGVAIWRVGSVAAGSWFAGVFAASVGATLLLGVAGLRGLAALPTGRSLTAKLALRELVRHRASSISGFVSIALCALLIGIAPQLRGILERDMEAPETGALPSLFLFDIQPEQVEPLTRHVEARGASLQRTSPMVRARLDAIDGAAVEHASSGDVRPMPGRAARSSEDETRRLRTRRYNLTFGDGLTPSEVLRDGRPFSGRYDPASGAPAEISLEIDFARRLGVGIGDTLAFDVQGVPVEGRVVNLREVRWNSFQPNFFVAFQPGVLEDAPQIFLASIPKLPAAEREGLQASITDAFPNVSSVDVTRAVRRLLGLLDQLQWALASTASLSLIVGLVLVYAVARDQARARRWETNLLKVLGADFAQIRGAVDLEFGLLGLFGAVAGAGASVAASALLARFVLEVDFAISWSPLLLALVGVPLVCALTGRAATRRVLRERPLVLLQSAES